MLRARPALSATQSGMAAGTESERSSCLEHRHGQHCRNRQDACADTMGECVPDVQHAPTGVMITGGTWLTLGLAESAGSGMAIATFCRSKSVVDSYSMLT